MPQYTGTYPQNAKTVNIVGSNNMGAQVKTGSGTLLGLTVNTAGTGSTLVAYDGTSNTGTKLASFTTTAQLNFDSLNWRFTTGLFLVTTGTVADITVAYA